MSEEIIKIALIHGETLINNKNKNGEIDYLTCTLENEYFHISLMTEYLEKNNIDDPLINAVNIYTAINKVGIILANLGIVVFFNTTSYREKILKIHGKTGVLIMPEPINTQQKESLIKLKEKILDFNEIQIWYDVSDDYNAQMIHGGVDVIDHFISKKRK